MHTHFIKQRIDQKSFLIESFLPSELKQVARSIPRSLINNELNSKNGIKISLDKPLGSKKYLNNLKRPAVLRQHFGARCSDTKLYSYGNGSGSLTVGTHPYYNITRETTPHMQIIADKIQKVLLNLSLRGFTQSWNIQPFNHCTVLFYYHKNNDSPNTMLGYHTDNIYSHEGKFDSNNNTQMEDTPTCVLTIGDCRHLCFEKQYSKTNPSTKMKNWTSLRKCSLCLMDNSLFVLHPRDEEPRTICPGLKVRWRHGVRKFSNKNSLSIALVFRTVVHTTPMNPIVGNSPSLSSPELSECIINAHERLKFLFHSKIG